MSGVDFEGFASAHGVRLLLQFGSTVSGRTHPASDLDLGALLARAPDSLHDYGTIAADLQALFPGRAVDLAILNWADPLFLKQVVDGGRLLYGSSRLMAELKIYAFKRYQDHRPFFEMERAYIRRKAAAAVR